MRVFIRKRTGAKFLAQGDEWVTSREQGVDFVSSVFALDAATRMKLTDIEIVLDFKNTAEDVILTLPDDSKNPQRLR